MSRNHGQAVLEVPESGEKPSRARERIVGLDFLRVSAAFAVVFLHASGTIIHRAQANTLDWWIAIVVNGSVRWAVPVFLMISGALLINPRAEDATQFWHRRASKLLAPLLFWSVVYMGLTYFLGTDDAGQAITIKTVLSKLVIGRPYMHLWYLYMLVGLYAFTPFINSAFWAMTLKDRYLLMAIAFLLGILYSITGQQIDDAPLGFLFWFAPNLGYFIAGAVLKQARWPARILVLPLVAVVLLSTTLTALGVYWLGDLSPFDTTSPTVVPMAIAIFLLGLRLSHASFAGHRLLDLLASASLGIYLVHPMVLNALARIRLLSTDHSSTFAILIAGTVAFLASAVGVIVLQKIPILRRVV